MKIRRIIISKKPLAFAEADFNYQYKFADIVLIDYRKRKKATKLYPGFLLSSDPLRANIYRGEDGREIYAVEFFDYPHQPIDFDLFEYIRSKEYRPARIIVSDRKKLPNENKLMTSNGNIVLRFSNHKNSNKLYQTNENIFFGLDEKGILSEFIYLGKEMTEKLLGKKITRKIAYADKRTTRLLESLDDTK